MCLGACVCVNVCVCVLDILFLCVFVHVDICWDMFFCRQTIESEWCQALCNMDTQQQSSWRRYATPCLIPHYRKTLPGEKLHKPLVLDCEEMWPMKFPRRSFVLELVRPAEWPPQHHSLGSFPAQLFDSGKLLVSAPLKFNNLNLRPEMSPIFRQSKLLPQREVLATVHLEHCH